MPVKHTSVSDGIRAAHVHITDASRNVRVDTDSRWWYRHIGSQHLKKEQRSAKTIGSTAADSDQPGSAEFRGAD